MHLSHIALFWRLFRIPGLRRFMRDWSDLTRTHFIFAAWETGLLSALADGATRDDVLKQLDVQRPELLDALLELGLALKELAVRNGVYYLKGQRAKSLMGSHGDFLAAVIQAGITYYADAYRHLNDRLHGAPLGDDLKSIGETVARFSKIGDYFLSDFIRSILPATSALKVLDVGCGSGFVLRTVADNRSYATGFGIDVDEKVATCAQDNLQQWGIADRFTVLSGDIAQQPAVLPNDFDLITAFNLLYYFPVPARQDFFSLLRDHLKPGGCLAVVNNFASQGRDAGAANLNVINCSLKGLTPLPDLAVTQEQLAATGFKRIEISRFMPRNEWFGVTAYI